jgi:hypothetical protein
MAISMFVTGLSAPATRKELIMKSISKALVGTIAAGAMAMTSAAPAQARGHDGIDVGDVIAGALIVGGIAAVASAAGNDRYDRGYNNGYVYEGRGYNGYNGYNRAGDSRQAVEQCVYAAERGASRYSRGGAQVTDIRNIDRHRDGYTVKGRIAVNTGNRNWRSGWGNDYRGWNDRYSGYDAGRFTCDVRYGRVVDLDYSGIRGLR